MKELKFRAWNTATNKIMDWEFIKSVRNLNKLIALNHVIVMQFTGFQDSKGVDIYESDTLTDIVKTDEGIIKSKQNVFWNQPTGSWHLDNSFNQDETSSTELWIELNDFKYSVSGNIHQKC